MAAAATASMTSVVPVAEVKTETKGDVKANGHHAASKVVNRPTFLKSKDGRYRFFFDYGRAN